MSDAPESMMLQLMRQMRAEIGDMRAVMATKSDLAELRAELRSEIHSLRVDIAADFIDVDKKIAGVRRDLGDQIVGLRRAVIDYHTTVIGHGALISDLEARVRRVEQHLDLPPLDSH